MFFVVLLLAVLSVPMLFIKSNHPELSIVFNLLTVFAISTIIFFFCYWQSYSKIHGYSLKNFLNFILMFFIFFSIAMGFSLHNTIAVLEGHLGKKSAFIRTPKFNLTQNNSSWKKNIYLKNDISPSIVFELLLCFYFLFAIYSAFYTQDFGLIIFHTMLCFGFGFVSIKSLASKV
jgi:hypothetical protein